VSFTAITLCDATQRVFIVAYSLSTQSGNFWIHLRVIPDFDIFWTFYLRVRTTGRMTG